jgi:hypothetical protein
VCWFTESWPEHGAVAMYSNKMLYGCQLPASSGETFESSKECVSVTQATLVTFGAGITVDSFTVDSATQITAQVTIDADATKGPRDVSVSVLETSGTLTNAFEAEAKATVVPMYV